ncbi:hypothetical protein KOW79_013271 [Hemibagrus wyckioides]|uniref:Uncharacterized protein n=1 Tax=Hemibagrus wyckioides TaxID=337641 RepID=A0A9D3SLF9_9TELE|nr:hypothetical protein KOW79_013271 [Hemibagrus wyckioides]
MPNKMNQHKHDLRSEQRQNSHPHTSGLTSISEKKEVLVLRSLKALLGKFRENESPSTEATSAAGGVIGTFFDLFLWCPLIQKHHHFVAGLS